MWYIILFLILLLIPVAIRGWSVDSDNDNSGTGNILGDKSSGDAGFGSNGNDRLN